ncbi:hypothetical protein BDV38DRAFT_246683 [Aspergillus pseudotamarii]|uniref:Uncharacterized protein n=1 Tax=Aspergillus pseudotamarii TaxID=132259 RepID=A0A5N6SUV5_ASPPS|nr:uncharacterized protein BDV38DRAFT_246683 [Aspergillus pseudotamarii]KAE8137677.1 hypothetical protein BDV38DRAFT_246683 [Aspergillus pseudotamarii]
MMYRVYDFVVWYRTVHAFPTIDATLFPHGLIFPLTMGRFLSVRVPTSGGYYTQGRQVF